jgi:hypothetical protein
MDISKFDGSERKLSAFSSHTVDLVKYILTKEFRKFNLT